MCNVSRGSAIPSARCKSWFSDICSVDIRMIQRDVAGVTWRRLRDIIRSAQRRSNSSSREAKIAGPEECFDCIWIRKGMNYNEIKLLKISREARVEPRAASLEICCWVMSGMTGLQELISHSNIGLYVQLLQHVLSVCFVLTFFSSV